MTGIEVKILVNPHKRQEFLHTVHALSFQCKTVDGCLSVEVFEQHGKPNHFLWLERWPDDLRARRRLQSDEFRALIGAVRVLGEMLGVEISGVKARELPSGKRQ